MTAAPLPAFDAAGRCLPPRRLRQGEVHRCRWTDHSPETIVDDRLSQASASPAAGHSCQASSGIQLGSPLVGTFAQSGERLRVEAPARPSRSNAPSGRPGGGGQRLGEDRPVKTTVLPAASSSSRGGCTAPAAQYSRPALPPVPAGRVGRVGRAPDRGSAQRCCCQPLAPRIPDVAGQPQPWPQPDKLDQVDVVNYRRLVAVGQNDLVQLGEVVVVFEIERLRRPRGMHGRRQLEPSAHRPGQQVQVLGHRDWASPATHSSPVLVSH